MLATRSAVSKETAKPSPRAILLRSTTKFTKRNRKRLLRYGLVAGNLAVLIIVVAFIVFHSGNNTTNFSALNTAEETKASNPLDTLSATDIAANVALMVQLPETGLIINEADSVNAGLSASVSSHEAVLKPQILSSDIKTKKDIIDYTVVAGDSLPSLAAKFGVTSDSIRWSNSLSSSTLRAGTSLVIPPINGIVYTVRSGDSAEELAKKFSVSKEQIVQFNDAEITGLIPNERIVIPGGTIKVSSSGTPYYAKFAFGNTAVYGYNGYVPGYCTWYVANKRIQIGRPLPANLGNAGFWDDRAPQGWNRTPAYGAAVVTDNSNPGHVAFVEEVREDGSVLISEMNRRRRYEITTRVFSAAEAANYRYIH